MSQQTIHRIVFSAFLLLLSNVALAGYACPDASASGGGWVPESCMPQTMAPSSYACPDRNDQRGGWLPEACQAPMCADCGVVEAVTEYSEDGTASGLGAAAGAVAGGLIGNQVGKGKGRTLATIIGAVGGGVAGHYGEKKLRGKKHWEVTVKMQDGSSRVASVLEQPDVQVGDEVRFEGDALVKN